MLELNIFKNNNRTSVSYGKYYAHVEYKKTTIVRGTVPWGNVVFGLIITRPSNTFSMAFQKVLRGLPANNPSYCLLHIAAKKKCVTNV